MMTREDLIQIIANEFRRQEQDDDSYFFILHELDSLNEMSIDGILEVGPLADAILDRLCACPRKCPGDCKGQCGCKYHHDAYQDFLSQE